MNFIEHSDRISLIASVLETINSHTCENIQHKCLNTRPWSLTGLKSHTQKCFYTVDLLTHIPVGILSIPNSKIVVQQSSMDFTHTPVGILSIPNTKIVVQQFSMNFTHIPVRIRSYFYHLIVAEITILYNSFAYLRRYSTSLLLQLSRKNNLTHFIHIPVKIFNTTFTTIIAENIIVQLLVQLREYVL